MSATPKKPTPSSSSPPRSPGAADRSGERAGHRRDDHRRCRARGAGRRWWQRRVAEVELEVLEVRNAAAKIDPDIEERGQRSRR